MTEILRYKDRIVGTIDGLTFFTQRSPSHFFRKYNGFGVSAAVLGILNDRGVENIEIKYFKTGGGIIIYKAKVLDFCKSDKDWTFGDDDRQKFLSKTEMKVIHET